MQSRFWMFLENLYNFDFSRGGPRCPPRPRIWRPRPIRKHPKFSKAPLRGAEILFSQRAREKKLARMRKKWVRTRVRTPVSACFGSIFRPPPPCAPEGAEQRCGSENGLFLLTLMQVPRRAPNSNAKPVLLLDVSRESLLFWCLPTKKKSGSFLP